MFFVEPLLVIEAEIANPSRNRVQIELFLGIEKVVPVLPSSTTVLVYFSFKLTPSTFFHLWYWYCISFPLYQKQVSTILRRLTNTNALYHFSRNKHKSCTEVTITKSSRTRTRPLLLLLPITKSNKSC